MKVYLSALRFYQISNNSGDPGIAGMACLEYIVKGIRRDGAISSATHRRERLPVTPILLRKIFSVWREGSDLGDAKMLWAAVCMAFLTFLRSENLHLKPLTRLTVM